MLFCGFGWKLWKVSTQIFGGVFDTANDNQEKKSKYKIVRKANCWWNWCKCKRGSLNFVLATQTHAPIHLYGLNNIYYELVSTEANQRSDDHPNSTLEFSTKKNPFMMTNKSNGKLNGNRKKEKKTIFKRNLVNKCRT